MSLPYVYLPRPGDRITVSRDGEDHCLLAVFADGASAVRVLPGEIPGVAAGIAAAMHEAAGLPAPVILERPASIITALGPYCAGLKIFADGGAVRMQATEQTQDTHHGYWFTRLEPGSARTVGAYLAACADLVESEPDPAEVKELATLIGEALKGPVIDSSFDLNTSRIAARAALRWFRDKQQRGESCDA